MIKHKNIIIIAAICILTASCNGVDKLLKSTDYEAKYTAAMKYYENNSYSKAIQLFENLSLQYHGREHAEDIMWYYAKSLYYEKDYYSASYHFKRFSRQYPYSENVEEAAFLSAYCRYLESPEYSLDQSLTREAITEFESFAERWPKSLHIPEVNRYLDELREKIMMKDYSIAYGYYYIEEYRAAYESLKNFINLYPDAPMREDAMYYMLRSSFVYATNSHPSKKQERLQQVLNDFERFNTAFPSSKHSAEVQKIYTKTRAELTAMEEQKM